MVKVDVTTGKPVSTIIEGENLKLAGRTEPINFDNYEFSADENKVLFSANAEPIYRQYSKADYYVYDLPTNKLTN